MTRSNPRPHKNEPVEAHPLSYKVILSAGIRGRGPVRRHTIPYLWFLTTRILPAMPHTPMMSQLAKKASGSETSSPLRRRMMRTPIARPPRIPRTRIAMTRVISKRPKPKPRANKTRMQPVKVTSETPTSSRVLTMTAQAGVPRSTTDSDRCQGMLTGKRSSSSKGCAES